MLLTVVCFFRLALILVFQSQVWCLSSNVKIPFPATSLNPKATRTVKWFNPTRLRRLKQQTSLHRQQVYQRV